MDFAIIETGGKQYKITPTSTLTIEKLAGEPGSTVVFDKVLMVVDGDKVQVGTPYLKDVTFEAVIEGEAKAKKIRILRYHAKARIRKHSGHRQKLSVVNFAGKPAKAATKAEPKAKTEKAAAKKPAKVAAKPETKKAPAKKIEAKK